MSIRAKITPRNQVVNVNRHVIAKNRTHGTNEPVFRIQRGVSGKAAMANAVAILGQDGKPAAYFLQGEDGEVLLNCGARAVLVMVEGCSAVAVDPSACVLTRD